MVADRLEERKRPSADADPESYLRCRSETVNRVRQETGRVFESAEAADEWLRAHSITLNAIPLDLLSSSDGEALVLRALLAIEYGLPP